jgi:thiol-disulfide isomerase/thioredoxin
MGAALQIGPLAIPYAVAIAALAAALAFMVGRRLARADAAQLENLLWQALAVGFLAARIAYVAQYGAQYLAAPLSVIDVRDGGFQPLAGFVAAALFAWARLRRRAPLRRPFWWAFALGAFVWGTANVALELHQRSQAVQLPPLALARLEGGTASLAAFSGKPLVVNIWATWCPPCVREVPMLQAEQARRADVHFVFVNQGEPRERVAGWLQARGFTLRNVLLDPQGRTAAAFGAQGLPTTLFFDSRGRLVSARTGELSAATLEERLRAAR